MDRIYLAGPLFTTYERAFLDECALELRRAGHEVFVPHEGFISMDREESERFRALSDRDKALQVFAKDYAALSWANVLVVIVDGPQIDDGSAVEIGIFREQMLAGHDKKGIFALTSDMRVGPNALPGEMKQINFFAAGAIHGGGAIYSTIEEIIERLAGEAGARSPAA